MSEFRENTRLHTRRLILSRSCPWRWIFRINRDGRLVTREAVWKLSENEDEKMVGSSKKKKKETAGKPIGSIKTNRCYHTFCNHPMKAEDRQVKKQIRRASSVVSRHGTYWFSTHNLLSRRNEADIRNTN